MCLDFKQRNQCYDVLCTASLWFAYKPMFPTGVGRCLTCVLLLSLKHVSGAAANVPPALYLYTICMLSNMMRSWQLLRCADVSCGLLCMVTGAAKAASVWLVALACMHLLCTTDTKHARHMSLEPSQLGHFYALCQGGV